MSPFARRSTRSWPRAATRRRDVTHLALSHYHWDHTANANAFAGATWLVRQVERDAMFADKPPGLVRRRCTYAALKNSKTIDHHHRRARRVRRRHRRSSRCAPGHTPGHQVLFVKLAKTGGVVLSGDLYHYPAGTDAEPAADVRVNEEQTRGVARGARRVSEEAPVRSCGSSTTSTRMRS